MRFNDFYYELNHLHTTLFVFQCFLELWALISLSRSKWSLKSILDWLMEEERKPRELASSNFEHLVWIHCLLASYLFCSSNSWTILSSIFQSTRLHFRNRRMGWTLFSCVCICWWSTPHFVHGSIFFQILAENRRTFLILKPTHLFIYYN